MSDIMFWLLIVIFAPFLMYVLFRILSSAIFKSFFEQKKQFEEKEEK